LTGQDIVPKRTEQSDCRNSHRSHTASRTVTLLLLPGHIFTQDIFQD
jgi:hypothetical protein